jgi:hypothetical protein
MDEGVGFPNNSEVYGHHEGTFYEFIRDMMTCFNGEVKIIGNTLSFEEKHFWNNNSPFIIPNTSNVGFTFNNPEPHSTNASELASSLFITYQTDQSELNTLHRYRGTSVQVILKPNITLNKKNWLLKNSEEYRLPVAMGRRKAYLSRIEILLNNIINALSAFANFIISGVNLLISGVNAILNLVSSNPPTVPTIPTLPTNIINNRVDWLALSNDSFSVPKLFLGRQSGGDWVLQTNSEIEMAAQKLLLHFHGKNLATRGNQQLIYTDKTFKFCCDDFLKVVGSNIVKDVSNRWGKLQTLKWNIDGDIASDVSYRIFSNFTNNLSEKIIVDGNG